MYKNIENYFEHNHLVPIRYSYKEITKMTKDFKEKIGEGGFGSVFKAKLCSEFCVAIKMLSKSKRNGQDLSTKL